MQSILQNYQALSQACHHLSRAIWNIRTQLTCWLHWLHTGPRFAPDQDEHSAQTRFLQACRPHTECQQLIVSWTVSCSVPLIQSLSDRSVRASSMFMHNYVFCLVAEVRRLGHSSTRLTELARKEDTPAMAIISCERHSSVLTPKHALILKTTLIGHPKTQICHEYLWCAIRLWDLCPFWSWQPLYLVNKSQTGSVGAHPKLAIKSWTIPWACLTIFWGSNLKSLAWHSSSNISFNLQASSYSFSRIIVPLSEKHVKGN